VLSKYEMLENQLARARSDADEAERPARTGHSAKCRAPNGHRDIRERQHRCLVDDRAGQ
jgi:hypothetical protein